MSAFGNPVPLPYRLTAAAVLAWLTGQGQLQEAVIYQRFFWDWAENVERRPGTYFADLVGSHRHTVRACVDRLEQQGLIRVRREARKVGIELVFEGVLDLLYGEIRSTFGKSSGHSESPRNVENDSTLDARASVWRLPVELEPRDANPCYVTIYDTGTVVGTVLANTTTDVLTTYVYGCNNYITNTCSTTPAISPTVENGATAGSASEPGSAKKKSSRRKGTGQRGKPTTSYGFRWATREQVQSDEHYPRIKAMHQAWCSSLGLDYELSNWRYAGWRQALVDQGYTEEQILGAVPALKRDPWWLERASDPHDMFGVRPDRIERFFPENATTPPDRLGRGASSTDESFTF